MTAEDWLSLFYGIGDALASFERFTHTDRHFTGEGADLPLIWGFFYRRALKYVCEAKTRTKDPVV